MSDHTQTLAVVLGLIRSRSAVTRPELVRQSDLGRAVVNQRVEDAIAAGILVEEQESVSTGGRPSKILRIESRRGAILAAVFGASRLHVALADLTGSIIDDIYSAWDIERGPAASIARLIETARELLARHPERELWAGAVGLPGPVDFDSGVPVAPPIMTGWDGYPVGSELETELAVPIWIDNDANLMALGTWHETRLASGDDMLLVKAGTGVGAGLISRGRLHRGARGAAGDIGHTLALERSPIACRCGNYGCLEAYAGGWALARDAADAGRAGESPFIAAAMTAGNPITIETVIEGALAGDRTCVELIRRSGALIGRQLASLVSFFNPATVFIGGSIARTGAMFLDEITAAVSARMLPLASAELVVREVPLHHHEGVIGAANLAIDEIFSPRHLTEWFGRRDIRALSGKRQRTVVTSTLADRMDILARVETDALASLPVLPLWQLPN